jgi:hypothetical protein
MKRLALTLMPASLLSGCASGIQPRASLDEEQVKKINMPISDGSAQLLFIADGMTYSNPFGSHLSEMKFQAADIFINDKKAVSVAPKEVSVVTVPPGNYKITADFRPDTADNSVKKKIHPFEVVVKENSRTCLSANLELKEGLIGGLIGALTTTTYNWTVEREFSESSCTSKILAEKADL